MNQPASQPGNRSLYLHARDRAAPAAMGPRALEPTLAAYLRPLVYLAGVLVFALPIASEEVAITVALCAFFGAIAGRRLASSSVRAPVIVLFTLALALLAGAARSLFLGLSLPAEALGPTLALRLGDALGLGLATFSLATAVRALALRAWPLRVLEVGFVGVAFAELVVAHRGGAINRPFALADSIIAAGGDPTAALLAVGAVAAIVSVLLLLSEQSLGRSLLHVLIVALLLSVVMTSTQMLGLPQPDPGKSSLGLRPKDDKQGKPKQGGPGQQHEPPKNDQLEFEDNYDSQGRRVPVAVVLLHDDYSPPADLYYFRQSAFSQWNGRRLVSAVQPGIDDDLAPGFVLAKAQLPEVPNVRDDRVLLDTTVALLSEHNRPFALESPVAIEPADNPDPGRFRRVYRVTSAALASSSDRLLGRGVGNPEWDEATRAHYLEVPEDPRYRELAAEIARELPATLADDPTAKAIMVSLYLGREGIYSLKSGHASAKDPTADFLFGDKVGYCVHFAHAAAFLMRSLGIPSRVATGYAIEEAARQGGSAILLTGAHSHAWPEIYVTGVGWTVLDVFPERSLDPPVSAPDPDLQRLLGEMARGQSPLPQGQDRPLEPLAAALRALPGLLGRALLVLVPLVIFLGYLVKLWRSLVPYVARKAAPRVAYRAALDRLSEISIARMHGETREAFAARVAGMPAFSSLTAEHVRARFGHGASRAPAELLALLRATARERAERVPFLRRARGVLRPFSWLRSR